MANASALELRIPKFVHQFRENLTSGRHSVVKLNEGKWGLIVRTVEDENVRTCLPQMRPA